MNMTISNFFQKIPYRNYLLVISVFLTVFIVPILPAGWHKLSYSILFTFIYFLAAFSMERHKKTILIMAISVFVVEWISSLIGLKYLYEIARVLTIIFFIIIVINLIALIARSKVVDSKVILDAINGYLLMALVFGLLVAILNSINPESFNFSSMANGDSEFAYDFSSPMYFSLVTTTTLGYGDIVPKTPAARSLATFIAVSGQLYIAIIIALLVGKFAARNEK